MTSKSRYGLAGPVLRFLLYCTPDLTDRLSENFERQLTFTQIDLQINSI
jgi:hypothetical protein